MRGVLTPASSVLLAALGLGACDRGGYEVRVRIPGDASRVARLELSVLRSCDDVGTPGDLVITTVGSVEVDGPGDSPNLGSVAPGSYGLYGRAFEEGCLLVAAGCAPVRLEAGGTGTLELALLDIPPRSCAPGEACEDERCVPEGGRCLPDGAACSTSASCCSGACDGRSCGRAGCGALGDDCETSDDCCDGAPCLGGSCFFGGACAESGMPCDVSDDCCSGMCLLSTCIDGGGVCVRAGELCAVNEDCCSALCDSGHCAELDECTVAGEVCFDDSECCSGQCFDTCDLVAGCRPAGEICSGGGGDCCSGECAGTPPRCQLPDGCLPQGELCWDDSECCGADCDDRCS